MAEVSWIEALTRVMWPNGEATDFLKTLWETYPEDWEGAAVHYEMALAEAAGEDLYPDENSFCIQADPICTIYQAKQSVITHLRESKRRAEGRKTIDGLPQPIQSNAWRNGDVTPSRTGFNLCYKPTKTVLFYDIWLIDDQIPEEHGDIIVPFIPTGAPGKDSGIAAVLTIFDERIAAGSTKDTVTKEAAALADAYDKDPRYPMTAGWPPMTTGVIENRIRSKFREMKKATK